MKTEAILFDLDGTLLDTIEDLADSANAMLAHYGAPTYSSEAYKAMIGAGLEELVRRALPEELRTEQTLAEAAELTRAAYREHWNQKTRPYPGIPELLSGLELPMAVVSNKPDDFTKKMVHAMLAEFRFEHIVGARNGVPNKPDPASALEVSVSLGVAPAACCFLGDSGIDMETAVNAGMRPIGVAWGFRDERELREHGAELILEQPLDLLRVI